MLEEERSLSGRQRYWLDHVQACEESGQTTKAAPKHTGYRRRCCIAGANDWRNGACGQFKRRVSNGFR